MRPVDFLTSLSHYGAHLAPIWHALAPEDRGTWWAPADVGRALRARGVDRLAIRTGRPRAPGTSCVVASQTDAAKCGARPVVLVEHGAGQAYDVANPAYSGGPGRDNVALFLCPNEVVASRNRARYGSTPAEVVGSPRLDDLIARARGGGAPTSSPVVALSFHWDCPLVPETRWAYPHYKAALPDLARAQRTIGHGHPRFAAACANAWARAGIDHVPEFEAVVDEAHLYVCDNSSTLFEWAALGRPVVVLNAPGYRRHIDAWPRFWACADVGLQVDEPEQLRATVETALEDPPAIATRRAEVVAEVFPRQDGQAAIRAVHALRETLG